MRNPGLLSEIIRAVVKSVRVPVMVKIRSGWNDTELLSPSLAQVAEQAGAAAVTLHARPVSNMHSGPINLEALRLTAAAVKIPVIGNGGVQAAPDARAIIETGCAGVAIGRGAVGNPAIFSEIAGELGAGGGKRLGASGRVKLFLRFIELNAGLYGEERGLIAARKLVGYWLKGLPGSAAARGAFMRMKTLKEANELLIQYTGEKNDGRRDAPG